MIPLFPLNMVLCPGEITALHIFEERYKEMIMTCLEEDRYFGIILIHNSELKQIGCTAQVIEIVKKYPDGRMDILIQGVQRFHLLSIDRKKSYLRGMVDYFSDEHHDVDLILRTRVAVFHLHLLEMAQAPESDKIYEKPNSSFLMAHSAGLDLEDKQKLLELITENDRLRFLEKHLILLIDKITHYEEVKKLIRANGHAKHFPPIDLDKLGGEG
ncbi:MAG: LON peptidase substrate-binding domain-containing protein [Bacteroidetes bacterium]|nr:LON peptidase substrate-binding domain-containing protein [Bacteroidota bacterium]